jgi:hypothetical protein
MNAVDNANAAGGSGETTPHEARPLWDVIREHMDRRGIEDVEELHRRFVETEHAYIPVPGRHRGKPASLEEFKRHVRGRVPRLLWTAHAWARGGPGNSYRERGGRAGLFLPLWDTGSRYPPHERAIGKPSGPGYPSGVPRPPTEEDGLSPCSTTLPDWGPNMSLGPLSRYQTLTEMLRSCNPQVSCTE